MTEQLLKPGIDFKTVYKLYQDNKKELEEFEIEKDFGTGTLAGETNQFRSTREGATITSNAFVSTSLDEKTAKSFSTKGKYNKNYNGTPVFLEILLPEGTCGVPLGFSNESELLLPPCSSFTRGASTIDPMNQVQTIKLVHKPVVFPHRIEKQELLDLYILQDKILRK